MISNDMNLNHLRVFEAVHRTGSMTAAAEELHLTQSGVSQHVRAFEEALGFKVFDRMGRRLVPTAAALELSKACREGFSRIGGAIAGLRGKGRELSGTVSIGMPVEFGNNMLLPVLSEFCLRHPRVRFSLRYGFATGLNELLLSGTLDFAFVDSFAPDPRIRIEPVYDEVLLLCATRKLVNRLGAKVSGKGRGALGRSRELFASLEYVDYQAGAPVLRAWFRHHFRGAVPELNLRATAMDVQGVARLIQSGLAAGVLPGHLVAQLGDRILVLEGPGKPMVNRISLAYLAERSHSPAAAEARAFLGRQILQRA